MKNLVRITLIVMIFCLTIDPHNYDIVWAGTQNTRGIYKSTDGSATWTRVTTEESFLTVAVSPHDSNRVLIGRQFGGMRSSTDGGLSWQAINQGLQMRTVNALALTPDSAHLYAATEGGGVYRYDVE